MWIKNNDTEENGLGNLSEFVRHAKQKDPLANKLKL